MKVAHPLDNGQIAELLALEAEKSKPPLTRALKRASRAALSWPLNAADLASGGQSLTVLRGVGPFLEKLILGWIARGEPPGKPSALRKNFLTLVEARGLLSKKKEWLKLIRGDLQMHTEWSDGENTVEEMANQGAARNYEYVAITDHAKSLKIAGGMTELELAEQGKEIVALNE